MFQGETSKKILHVSWFFLQVLPEGKTKKLGEVCYLC